MSKGGQNPGRTTEHLANERTFLAWVRTSIALMGLGFVVARFSLFLREFGILTKGQYVPSSSTHSFSTWLGVGMIFLGILLLVYSLVNYMRAQKSIDEGEYLPKHNIIYLAAIGLVIFGAIVIFYLALISAG